MKNKTKKKIFKIFNMITIAFMVLNLFGILSGVGSNSFADDVGNGDEVAMFAIDTAVIGGLSAVFSGIPFIIITVIKLIVFVVGFLIQTLMSGVYSSLEGNLKWAGLEDIIFAGTNGASVFLDVNFFDFSNSNNSDTVIIFREAIAKWYYILRLISVSALLVILIYVGIKMALSTVAQDKAKYKEMFVNWAISLALLFLLHYIIIFIISVNAALVKTIKNIPMGSIWDTKETATSVLLTTILGLVWLAGLEGIFATIIYVVFVGTIFKFFLLYVKRMITVGFLIMISPLITITYSIDKMGDNKAQALNAWLKEISYNILIQPFHCIIYMTFFDAIKSMITSNPTGIGAYIFAIVVINFMSKAEEILRKIFHFEAHSMGSIGEAGQNMMNATGKFTQIGMATATAFSNFKSSGGLKAAKERAQLSKVNRNANKQLKEEFKKSGNDGTFKDYKKSEAGQNKLNKIKAKKMNEIKQNAELKRSAKVEKTRKKYNKKYGEDAFDKKVKEEFDAKYGEGEYERNKELSKQTLPNGRPTIHALKAQEKLNGIGMQIGNEISNSPIRKIKRWSNTDYGKLVMAAGKDSIEVANAIAMGGIGFGAGGGINDAITGGQLGYGLAKGILENSSRTIINQTTTVAEKTAGLSNIPNNEQDLEKYFSSITAKGMTGQLDAKPLNDLADKLKTLISAASKDGKSQGYRSANELINKIQRSISNDDIKIDSSKIEEMVANLNLQDDQKDDILKEVKKYATTFGESMIYSYQTQAEKFGLDQSQFSKRTAKKVSEQE